MNFLNAANIDLGIASELGLPIAAGERAGRERKTAFEILEQIFMQLKPADYVSPPAHREGWSSSE